MFPLLFNPEKEENTEIDNLYLIMTDTTQIYVGLVEDKDSNTVEVKKSAVADINQLNYTYGGVGKFIKVGPASIDKKAFVYLGTSFLNRDKIVSFIPCHDSEHWQKYLEEYDGNF